MLSALSIPSFPPLYYPPQLNPKAINLAKPLLNLPTIPKNIKLLPPNHFQTSLHIPLSPQHTIPHSSQTNNHLKHIKHLDHKFSNLFSNT
ncbi:accessory Sec system protein Asp2, partial [Staphylococcus warneri]|uniref:accessory Sec system protein Asp2 n=1 Tax=Staphylococcus warneri TaxID=1292 RepID=UPI0028CB3A3A